MARASIHFETETLLSRVPALVVAPQGQEQTQPRNDDHVTSSSSSFYYALVSSAAARLQFLPENPFLCHPVQLETSSFVKPGSVSAAEMEPVALLAKRGRCSVSRKLAVAQSIHSSVQFLILYNDDNHNDDMMDDDFDKADSSSFSSRLVLVPVTFQDGEALRDYVQEQPHRVYRQGGPVLALAMSSQPPFSPGVMTTEDWQQCMVTVFGLILLLVTSLCGCIIILHETHGNNHRQLQLQQLHGVSSGHIVFSLDTTTFIAAPPGGVRTTTSVARLSLQQAQQLPTITRGTMENHGSTTMLFHGDRCAICLDEEADDSSSSSSSLAFLSNHDDTNTATTNMAHLWTVLPCQHLFHSNCIVPWLTERQAICPLCKHNVLQHLLLRNASSSPASSVRRTAATPRTPIDNDDDNNDNRESHHQALMRMVGGGEASDNDM